MSEKRIDLNIPPEPKDIKEFIRKTLKVFEESEGGVRVFNDWMKSLSVWYGNKLPSYLWSHWRDKLVSYGYSWQKFLRVLKNHTKDTILWAIYDKLSWSDLVSRIINSTEKHV